MTLHQVQVDGGELTVETHHGDTDPVLAVHGMSSNRRLWNWLRAESPGLGLIAPDLRGRADSVAVTGSSSVRRHAEDMVAVLDAFGLDRVPVLGMSLGGFVAIELATHFADRVSSLVLVDGGFPMAAPAGLTEATIGSAFADRVDRLQRTWTLDEYAEFCAAGIAPMPDPADPLLRDFLAHDLAEDGSVRLSGDALGQDAGSIYFGRSNWQELRLPIRFLHAEWSVGPDSPPSYPADAVARYAEVCLEVRFLASVDHAGTIMSKPGAVAVAELVTATLP